MNQRGTAGRVGSLGSGEVGLTMAEGFRGVGMSVDLLDLARYAMLKPGS